MIHLVTSFVHGSAEDRALRKWLKDGESLGMNTVAWTELLCGLRFARGGTARDG